MATWPFLRADFLVRPWSRYDMGVAFNELELGSASLFPGDTDHPVVERIACEVVKELGVSAEAAEVRMAELLVNKVRRSVRCK